MDAAAAGLASVIGARVRRERQARQWTLDHLADVAGLSRRMLVSVEQGSVNPSVGTLLRISDALGVGLPELVEPPQREPLTVTRAGEGAVLWTGAAGGRGRLVAGTVRPEVLELWDWTLGPGDVRESEAHAPGTKELLQVQEGAVEVRVGEQREVLGAGDAAAFPGDVAHRYSNAGGSVARFVLAVFEPGVGAPRPVEAGDA
ncbi:MAG: helix-turn-helix domain-containing protein [Amnibacterium sp.]